MAASTRTAGRWSAVLRYTGAVALVAVSFFPFAWMIITALTPAQEIRGLTARWFPENPTLDNFLNVFTSHEVSTLLMNSLLVAGVAALVSTTVAVLAAYGLSRFASRFGTGVTFAILMAQMLPTVLLVVPYFIMLRSVGLLDTLLALILTNIAFTLPVSTWLLRRFIHRVPQDFDEAAMIDGCARFGALLRVTAPIARPGIGAAFIYAFLVSWHEYLFALSLTSSGENRVVTVGIASLIGQYGISWGELMAMGVLAVIPLVVLFLFVERSLVEGLAGGVKG